MATYTVALRERQEVAERTLGFSLDKPANFTFKAGQFLDIILLNPPETDAEGNRRALSIASAPHEGRLQFATRHRQSAFKRVLNTMALGSEVRIEGPFGNLLLHGDAGRPAVMLAGGIGITPFRSMILDLLQVKNETREVTLYWGLRHAEDLIWQDEFQELSEHFKNFRFHPVLSRAAQEWPLGGALGCA